MKRLFTGPAFALALSASAFVSGCSSEATTDKPEAPAAPAAPAEPAAADGAEAEAGEASAATVSTELTPDELAAANVQKMCPVSDEELGSMGGPIKVSIKGRDIYLCCEACVDAVKEDPDKYIAILDAAKQTEGGDASDAATDAPAESAPAADGATS